MVVLVAKECNIRVNASNEVTRFIFGGSGVMVSAWWTICKTKQNRGPPAFESFQVHGQFPNQNYTKSNQNSALRSTGAKDTSFFRSLASGPFEKALGSSFDVHRCLSASYVWMKLEETGRNQENVSDIFISYHNLSSPSY